MANVVLYVSPKLKPTLKSLKRRLKESGTSLSGWFAEQVKASEAVQAFACGTKPDKGETT